MSGLRSSDASSSTAPRQNSWPTTADGSITPRSPELRRSSRAPRSAWMVGGIDSSDRSATGLQCPSCRSRRPSSTSMRSNSSTNSGFPSAAAVMRTAASLARLASPSRCSIRSSLSSSPSGRSTTVLGSSAGVNAGTGLPQLGTSHVQQEDGLAAAVVLQVLEEVEKRGLGPVESSKTTTSGDSWARHSKNLRAAQKVSSGVDAAAERPSAAAMLRAIPLPSASPGRRSAILACASSAESAS